MPFEDLIAWRSARSLAPDGPAAYIRMTAGKTGPVCTIGLTPALVAQLGWQPGDSLELAAGIGPDIGRLRIKAGVNGWRLSKLIGRVMCLTSKVIHHSWRRDALPSTPCEIVPGLAAGVLLLRLPAALMKRAEG